jgi:alpha-N-arabinofuranosidase
MANLRRKNGRDQPWKLKYFGIGNENWGCGGKMRVEYYADLYRRYQTFVRDFSGNQIYKIACGPSEADYHWTEVMMREGVARTEPFPDEVVTDIWEHHRPEMDGLALHFYTRNRANYDSATQFDEDLWFDYMKRTLVMEELIQKHTAIMDKYDPQKNVDLIVDEWGTWFKVEPGTNPGFLYQQNTLRDALVAGINLNIFNNHCDRVHMANVAQMVNVLQAMILTEGEKMILTPSYHVFEMYKVHQDATLLPVSVSSRSYHYGEDSLPTLNVSASQNDAGKIHVSICNIDPNNSEKIMCNLNGINASSTASGRILTADQMNEHNTFDHPEKIKPDVFNEIEFEENRFSLTIPSKSVLVIEIQ